MPRRTEPENGRKQSLEVSEAGKGIEDGFLGSGTARPFRSARTRPEGAGRAAQGTVAQVIEIAMREAEPGVESPYVRFSKMKDGIDQSIGRGFARLEDRPSRPVGVFVVPDAGQQMRGPGVADGLLERFHLEFPAAGHRVLGQGISVQDDRGAGDMEIHPPLPGQPVAEGQDFGEFAARVQIDGPCRTQAVMIEQGFPHEQDNRGVLAPGPGNTHAPWIDAAEKIGQNGFGPGHGVIESRHEYLLNYIMAQCYRLLYGYFMMKKNMQIINDLVTGEDICVLATMDGNMPHTSLMVFFADHAAMKFYFLTRSSSRKYKNLKQNPHVSLLIDRRDEDLALSITGHHLPIKKEQTVEAIKKLYLLKHPEMEEFANHPETELIRILGTSAELALDKDVVFNTKLKNA